MVERACQILIKDNAWRRVPNARVLAEKRLRETLEADGCHDIELTEPEYRLIEPDEDHSYEPFWAWEIFATGVRDDPVVSAAPAIINNWRELEDPLGAEKADRIEQFYFDALDTLKPSN